MKKVFSKLLVAMICFGLIIPGWAAISLSTADRASAATSSSGGDSSLVNGMTGTRVLIDPITIISSLDGDIDSSGIRIKSSTNTSADIHFDPASLVTATPSAGLDLGSGDGVSVVVTPEVHKVEVPVLTASAPAGSSVTVSGIKIFSAAHGTLNSYRGFEQLRAITAGGTTYLPSFPVDAQIPRVNNSRITVSGATGSIVDTYKKGDSVNVSWDNTLAGDHNSDISTVMVDYSEFGGGQVAAVNNADIWTASYLVAEGLNLSGKAVSVVVTDLSGNVKTRISTELFDVDTQAPEVTINRQPNADVSANSYTLSATFANAVSGTEEYQIDGGIWTLYAGEIVVSAEGSHVYSARATDTVGNVTVSQVNFKVDTSIPAVPQNIFVTPGDGEVNITWDAVAGASYYLVSYDGNSPVQVSTTYTKVTGLTNGSSYNFSVIAVGANGLKSTAGVVSSIPVAATPATLASVPVKKTVSSTTPTSTDTTAPSTSTPNTTAPSSTDDNGQIKGDESTSTPVSEDSFNWTPWIILIVIIALAGAATGGYFYWTRGEEMAAAPATVTVSKKSATSKKPSAKSTGLKKNNRW